MFPAPTSMFWEQGVLTPYFLWPKGLDHGDQSLKPKSFSNFFKSVFPQRDSLALFVWETNPGYSGCEYSDFACLLSFTLRQSLPNTCSKPDLTRRVWAWILMWKRRGFGTVLELAGAVLRLGCASDAEHGSYNLKEGWVTDSCLLLCSGPDNLVQVVFTLFLPKSMPRGSIIPEAYFPSGNANDHSNLSIFV